MMGRGARGTAAGDQSSLDGRGVAVIAGHEQAIAPTHGPLQRSARGKCRQRPGYRIGRDQLPGFGAGVEQRTGVGAHLVGRQVTVRPQDGGLHQLSPGRRIGGRHR